jgi:hypothetical protein
MAIRPAIAASAVSIGAADIAAAVEVVPNRKQISVLDSLMKLA